MLFLYFVTSRFFGIQSSLSKVFSLESGPYFSTESGSEYTLAFVIVTETSCDC